MQYVSTKFWLWLEIDFPSDDEIPDIPGPQEELEGPQGSQIEGPQCTHELEGDTVCFEVISYRGDFEINGIPTAQVNVPLGRRADGIDEDEISTIHLYVDDLKLQLPARIWCTAKTLSESADFGDLWPPEKFKIFDGYVTGSAFIRNEVGANLVLTLTHWLNDLNFSSSLSKLSHPLNPSQLYQPPNYTRNQELGSGTALSDTTPLMIGSALAQRLFLPTVIEADFWGGTGAGLSGDGIASGLKDWFLSIALNDRVNVGQVLRLAGVSALSVLYPTKNWEACRALIRFEPNAQTPLVNEDGYTLGVPLQFAVNGQNTHIATAIGNEIGTESIETYSNMTIWDKLAGQFHANYMYSIIPLVDKALVVPYVPGLRSSTLPGATIEDPEYDDLIHRTIRASDYDSIAMSNAIIRPLRAVGLMIGKNYQAGGNIGTQPTLRSFGGWFDRMTRSSVDDPGVDPRYAEGLVMLKDAPRWMSNIIPAPIYSGNTTGTNINETVRTVSAITGGALIDTSLLPSVIFGDLEPIWDAYAHTLYAHEVLKGRQGTLTGPVRFDIAPGSSLKIELTEDKYVRSIIGCPTQIGPGQEPECECDLATYFYCSVLRVSINIDCQAMSASTTFQLGYLRDKFENTDRGTSVPSHPLWQNCIWGGCVLVQDDAFDNGEGLATTFCS